MISRATLIRNASQHVLNHGDIGDQAVAGFARELEVGVAVIRSIEQLEEREAASHTEAGLKGICKECGDPIEPARLKAKPNAVRCVLCQEEHESKQGAGFRFGRRK